MMRSRPIPSGPLLECPRCGLPAEITERFTLNGAPAPVEHVKLVCVLGHWYTPPIDRLPLAESQLGGAITTAEHPAVGVSGARHVPAWDSLVQGHGRHGRA